MLTLVTAWMVCGVAWGLTSTGDIVLLSDHNPEMVINCD
jgi:hypothetical protein